MILSMNIKKFKASRQRWSYIQEVIVQIHPRNQSSCKGTSLNFQTKTRSLYSYILSSSKITNTMLIIHPICCLNSTLLFKMFTLLIFNVCISICLKDPQNCRYLIKIDENLLQAAILCHTRHVSKFLLHQSTFCVILHHRAVRYCKLDYHFSLCYSIHELFTYKYMYFHQLQDYAINWIA